MEGGRGHCGNGVRGEGGKAMKEGEKEGGERRRRGERKGGRRVSG